MPQVTTESIMKSTISSQPSLEPVPLWIDGSKVSSSENLTFVVRSAKQEKDVSLAQSAGVKDSIRAADSSIRAFQSWKNTSAAHRRDLLLKAIDIFEARKAEAVQLQVAETSCEPSWAGFNVGYGLTVLREIASRITSVYGEMPRVASENNLCLVFKEPIGPCLLIAP